MTAAPAGLRRRSRFAGWKIRFSGAYLTMAPAVEVSRSPVSRLFRGGVGRYADSVLIAAGDRNTCEADLELSRVTRLKGRADATPLARLGRSCSSLEPRSKIRGFKDWIRGFKDQGFEDQGFAISDQGLVILCPHSHTSKGARAHVECREGSLQCGPVRTAELSHPIAEVLNRA